MTDIFGLLIGTILRLFRTRRSLLLENLVLRQQLAGLMRRRPNPKLTLFDKLFWVLARKFWSGWKQALIVVSPDTVVRWHRIAEATASEQRWFTALLLHMAV